MTDTSMSRDGADWLPGLGWLDMDPERVELIKGLYQLAAWIAEHRDLPMPTPSAHIFAARFDYDSERALVDEVAPALGVSPQEAADGRYEMERFFGPIKLNCWASAPGWQERYDAWASYRGCITPDTDDPADTAFGTVRAGGSR